MRARRDTLPLLLLTALTIPLGAQTPAPSPAPAPTYADAQRVVIGGLRRIATARLQSRSQVLHYTVVTTRGTTRLSSAELWVRGGSVVRVATDSVGHRTERAILQGVTVERAPSGELQSGPNPDFPLLQSAFGRDPFNPLGGTGEALTPSMVSGLAGGLGLAWSVCPDGSPCLDLRVRTPVTFPDAPSRPGERVSRWRLKDSVLVLTELHTEVDTFRLTGLDVRPVLGVPAPTRVRRETSHRPAEEEAYSDVRLSTADTARFQLPAELAMSAARTFTQRGEGLLRGGSPPPSPDVAHEIITVSRGQTGTSRASSSVTYDRYTRGADVVVTTADSSGARVEAVVGNNRWTKQRGELRAFVSPPADSLRRLGSFPSSVLWPWTTAEAPRAVGLRDAECEVGPCVEVALQGSAGASGERGWLRLEPSTGRVWQVGRVRAVGARPDTTVLTMGQFTTMANAIRPALTVLVHADTTWSRRLLRMVPAATDTLAFVVPVEVRGIP